MARPVIYETLQIGKETTPGTAVAADIQPLSTMVQPTTVMASEDVQSSGQRADVDVINGKEYTEFDISGKLALTDLLYWFSSALGQANVTSNTAVIQLDQEAAHPVAYTVEYASSSGLFKASGCRVSELSLQFSPDSAPTFSGKMIGGAATETGSRTASPTKLPVQHAGPKQVALWISTTLAGLTTAGNEIKSADGLYGAELTVSNLVETVLTVSEDSSYAFLSDTKPSIQCKVSMERGTAKFASYMAALRAGTLMYAKIVVKGPTVSGIQSRLELVFPFKFRDPAGSQNSGQVCGDFVMSAIYDGPATSTELGTALRAIFNGGWIANSSYGISADFDNSGAFTNEATGVLTFESTP